jgi:hypothetical protein
MNEIEINKLYKGNFENFQIQIQLMDNFMKKKILMKKMRLILKFRIRRDMIAE